MASFDENTNSVWAALLRDEEAPSLLMGLFVPSKTIVIDLWKYK